MPLSAKVLTINCPASTGAQAYTGVGFQPEALILWYTTRTSDGSSPNVAFGLGIATSPTERFAVGTQATDNVGATAVRRAVSDAHCIRLVTNDGATTGIEADLDSFDSDGFTLDWSIVVNGADIHVLALAGLDAKAVAHTLWTTTGAKSVTGAGFTPAFFLGLHSDTTAAAAGGASSMVGLSATDGVTLAGMFTENQDFAGAGDSGRFVGLGKLFPTVGYSVEALTGYAETFTSWDSDGFTVTLTADPHPTAYIANALCLGGLSVKVGTLTVPGSTGLQAITGVGFTPKAVLCFGGHAAFHSNRAASLNVFFGGASGATSRAVIATADADTADPTQCDHDSDATKLIKAITPGTPTVDLAADLTSFDADGFTLDWTTAGTGAGTDQVVYIAFGNAPGDEDPAPPAVPGPGDSGYRVAITDAHSTANPVVIDLTGGSLTWAVSDSGTFNGEAMTRDLLAANLLPPRRLGGKRLRWEHPDLGVWWGPITAPHANGRTATTELVARTWDALFSGRRTPKVADTGMAAAGWVFRRAAEDRYRASDPIGVDVLVLDSRVTVSSVQRAADLGNLLRSLIRETGEEYRPHHTGMRIDWSSRVGEDKSHRVVLSEGGAIVDFDYQYDLDAIANEVLVIPALSPYDQTRSITVRDENSISKHGLRQTAVVVPSFVTRAALRSVGYGLLRRMRSMGDTLTLVISNQDRVWGEIREGDSVEARLPSINLRCRFRVLVRYHEIGSGLLTLAGTIEAEL